MAGRSPAAQTAFGTMVIVAIEQSVPTPQRLVQDDLAVGLLPAGTLIVGACRWSSVRDLFVSLSARRAPGVWGGVLCRKRYADGILTAALDDGIDQVASSSARAWIPAPLVWWRPDPPTCSSWISSKTPRIKSSARAASIAGCPRTLRWCRWIQRRRTNRCPRSAWIQPAATHSLRLGGSDAIPDRAWRAADARVSFHDQRPAVGQPST